MREVVYAHLYRNHIPAPQANFVELYINNEYWGPYTNLPQVNKDMLEELYLVNPSGEIIDALSFTNQEDDISYGRTPNGIGDFYTTTPSPLVINTDALALGVELIDKEKFEIYPNSTDELVTINLLSVNTYALKIYNAIGKKYTLKILQTPLFK